MGSLAEGAMVGKMLAFSTVCCNYPVHERVQAKPQSWPSQLLDAQLRRPRTATYLRRSPTVNCSASSSAGSAGGQSAGSDESPYLVLGVSPLQKFDSIKSVYDKKYKEAERRGDEVAMARLDRAYDKIMMVQLANRKQGRTFGDLEISKEIKYADKRIWFPWGPKMAVSSNTDCLINFAFANAIAIWIYVSGVAEWKPLQFLIFGYAWRIFNKLKEFEPAASFSSSEDEDQKRREKNGKRMIRTLALVFGCVAIASLAFTGVLNVFELLGQYIPRSFFNSQELFVTIVSAILLFITGSYLR